MSLSRAGFVGNDLLSLSEVFHGICTLTFLQQYLYVTWAQAKLASGSANGGHQSNNNRKDHIRGGPTRYQFRTKHWPSSIVSPSCAMRDVLRFTGPTG